MARGQIRDAFITAAGSFLPGAPVSNDEMEAKLGLVAGKPSRYRQRILRSNGIATRHYAIDAEGIPCLLAGIEQASTAAVPGTSVQIQVPAADAERARTLIAAHEPPVEMPEQSVE